MNSTVVCLHLLFLLQGGAIYISLHKMHLSEYI